jgi:hypothetical protein
MCKATAKGKAPNCSFHFIRNASPQLRHEIWSRSARAALPPKYKLFCLDLFGFAWIHLADPAEPAASPVTPLL